MSMLIVLMPSLSNQHGVDSHTNVRFEVRVPWEVAGSRVSGCLVADCIRDEEAYSYSYSFDSQA